MKNKIVGVGVGIFVFLFIFIVVSSQRDPNHFKDVTEMHITISDQTYGNKTTSKSLVINNQEVIKELIKPLKKFEFTPKQNNINTNYIVSYEVKMNNGYSLTFGNNLNSFDQTCQAKINNQDLEQCAPKDFYLQIINIIQANT